MTFVRTFRQNLLFILTALLLVFLPFQLRLVRSGWLPNFTRYFDEIAIATIFVTGCAIVLYRRKMRIEKPIIWISLSLFLAWCLLSGLINGRSTMMTLLGSFDYVKNFLPLLIIPLFGLSFRGKFSLQRLYRIVRVVALVIAATALLQEVLFWLNAPAPFLQMKSVRLGLLRPQSLMHNPLSAGVYSFLVLSIELSIKKGVTPASWLLAAAALLSVSRSISLMVLLLSFYFLWRQRKPSLILLFVISLIFTLTLWTRLLPQTLRQTTVADYYSSENPPEGRQSFRGYALRKSNEIVQDSPLTGSGPGSFGGIISLLLDSPVYAEYQFESSWIENMERIKSICQFWTQLVVETGVAGAFFFLVFYLSVLQKLCEKSVRTRNSDGAMLYGLSVALAGYSIYLCSTGLNAAFFITTASILSGAALLETTDDSFAQKDTARQ